MSKQLLFSCKVPFVRLVLLHFSSICVVMDSLLVFGLLLVVAVGVSGHDDYQCPLGFEPTHCSSGKETRKCKCMEDLTGNALWCNEENQQLHLQFGYCMSTNSDSDMTVVIGKCPYIHPLAGDKDIPLPPNMTASEVNGYMCGEMNRTGRLCGRCENGTGPSVFSPDLKCVRCLDSSYGWAVYLAVEFIPITVFVLLIVLFRIKICSGFLNALVFFCNITSAGLFIDQTHYRMIWSSNFDVFLISLFFSMYNIFSLRFFQNFLPPLCIDEGMTNLGVIALQYVAPIYPFILLLVIYKLVCLHEQNFKPLVIIWRPFGAIYSRFYERSNLQDTLVDASSLFVLAYFSIALTSSTIFRKTDIFSIKGDLVNSSTVFFMDGSSVYVPSNVFFLLAVFICVSFILFPTVLMFVFPAKTFQKCLNLLGLKCLPLHLLMDAFQGCYKNGTDGARNYRYFAGIYLVFRLMVFTRDFFDYYFIFLVIFSLLFALFRPYKRQRFNFVDCFLLAFLALAMFFVSYSNLPKNSKSEKAVVYLFMCIPLFYLMMLAGYYLFKKYRISVYTYERIKRKILYCFSFCRPKHRLNENTPLLVNNLL